MNRGIFCLAVFLLSTPAHSADAVTYVRSAALTLGVPVSFALRIAHIESGARCGINNKSSGATGPMQILPSTARGLGYHNIRKASCSTQVYAGMKYLSYCLRITGHSRYNAARCYTGGPGALKFHNKRVHHYAMKASR